MKQLDDGLRSIVEYCERYPYGTAILIIIGFLIMTIGLTIGVRVYFPMTVQCLT